MSSYINTEFYDRVQYKLNNKHLGELIISEPIGWRDDEKEYARHEQYHGIFAKFSNALKFIENGADYIQTVLDLYGINEDIQLAREERHPQTDVWTLTYTGFLDLSTWTSEKNQVSVKFNSGGIEQLLKSRESENVEIDRLTSIDGSTLEPLNTETIILANRRIFLKSQWKADTVNSSGRMEIFSYDGNERSEQIAFPLTLVNRSHESAADTYPNTHFNEAGAMFFLQTDSNRALATKFDFTFKFRVTDRVLVVASHFKVILAKYTGQDYVMVDQTDLFTIQEPDNANWQTGSVTFNQIINLQKSESLALHFEVYANFKDGELVTTQKLYIDTKDIEGEMIIEENSFFENSPSKIVLAYEMAEKLVAITTNQQKAFYSDFLGRRPLGYDTDGAGAYIGLTHGFWVRGFDKYPIPSEIPKIENLFKPLTTSFKDYISSMTAVWNIGISIEKKGVLEQVRLEELSFFYNNNVTIRLPLQVKNIKRSIDPTRYYSSLEFGYQQGGDYDEACGLDEYNVQANFSTVISRVKNVFSQISKYRADSYGLEFARRKPKINNDTLDTKYDSEVFFLDLKRQSNGALTQRNWSDDFEKKPTGVFSPETATNLRLSPINCLMRHSWRFSGGLKKYATDFIRYGSSKANSRLSTKFIGRPEYSENGKIINSELQNPIFLPEIIDFEHVCNFEIMQQVEGYSTINNKQIINLYGLVEFINEKNQIERGYLLNLKPNGNGNWKLLKSNKI